MRAFANVYVKVKHVLFIAFHYPPEASSSGVLRTLKFTRYLEELGWRVSVLTLNKSAYAMVDPALEAQIPKSAHVIRTPFINTKWHLAIKGRYPALLAIPDNWIGWYPWAINAGSKLISQDPPQVIYSTSPHATSHLIARRLAQKHHLPWIADFRDPWYEEPAEPGTPAINHWAARHLEKKVIKAASHVTATTDALRDSLSARYADLPIEKFSTIANGYDETDFAGINKKPIRSPHMVILHAGSINPDYRDPRPLWDAYREALKSGELQEGIILFKFIGPGEFSQSLEIKTYLTQYNMQDAVEFLPRLPYAQALSLQAEADLLLLLQASRDTEGLVPAKLYEYLRCLSPVLALVPMGASQRIIEETRGGWAIDPSNKMQISGALIETYHLWKEGKLKERAASLDSLQQYDRKALTRKLADIFNSLAIG